MQVSALAEDYQYYARLLESIEQTRMQLEVLASNKGLHHPEVVRKSQLLDLLLNQYYHLHPEREDII